MTPSFLVEVPVSYRYFIVQCFCPAASQWHNALLRAFANPAARCERCLGNECWTARQIIRMHGVSYIPCELTCLRIYWGMSAPDACRALL